MTVPQTGLGPLSFDQLRLLLLLLLKLEIWLEDNGLEPQAVELERTRNGLMMLHERIAQGGVRT